MKLIEEIIKNGIACLEPTEDEAPSPKEQLRWLKFALNLRKHNRYPTEGDKMIELAMNNFDPTLADSITQAAFGETILQLDKENNVDTFVELSIEEVAPEFDLQETLADIERMKSEMDLSALKK